MNSKKLLSFVFISFNFMTIESTLTTVTITNGSPFPVKSMVSFIAPAQRGSVIIKRHILASGQKVSFTHSTGLPQNAEIFIIKNLKDHSFNPLLGEEKSRADAQIDTANIHFWIMYNSRKKKLIVQPLNFS